MKRAQNKTLRVLQLLDSIAHLRMPFTVQEATHLLEEKYRSQVNVCERTIARDLDLLANLNCIYIHQETKMIAGNGSSPAKYKIDPIVSKNLTAAAASLNGPKRAPGFNT